MNLIVGQKASKTIILTWKDFFFCTDKVNIYSQPIYITNAFIHMTVEWHTPVSTISYTFLKTSMNVTTTMQTHKAVQEVISEV